LRRASNESRRIRYSTRRASLFEERARGGARGEGRVAARGRNRNPRRLESSRKVRVVRPRIAVNASSRSASHNTSPRDARCSITLSFLSTREDSVGYADSELGCSEKSLNFPGVPSPGDSSQVPQGSDAHEIALSGIRKCPRGPDKRDKFSIVASGKSSGNAESVSRQHERRGGRGERKTRDRERKSAAKVATDSIPGFPIPESPRVLQARLY